MNSKKNMLESYCDNIEICTDLRGDKWERTNIFGWFRQSDRFFWPSNPIIINKYGILPPSVEEIKKIKENTYGNDNMLMN